MTCYDDVTQATSLDKGQCYYKQQTVDQVTSLVLKNAAVDTRGSTDTSSATQHAAQLPADDTDASRVINTVEWSLKNRIIHRVKF